MKRRMVCFFIMWCFLSQTAAADPWPDSSLDREETTIKGKEVKIAIIDTGISSSAIDKKRIVEGKNYVDVDAGTEDKVGHGTAIAGIISELVTEASLVPLVCFSKDESGNHINGGTESLIKAIRDAVNYFKCNVIVIGSGIREDSKEIKAAIEQAEKKGAVVVSSVGNENEKNPEFVYYPAAYKTVLGVAALREDGNIAEFSQRNEFVSLSAPGVNLQVLTIRGKRVKAFGTSYAAAFVAGAVAQIRSECPSLDPQQVRNALCETAKDIGAVGFDYESGYGALQIKDALFSAKAMEALYDEQRGQESRITRSASIAVGLLLLLGGSGYVIFRKRKK